MRSTECDPLSIRTPPRLTAGSDFHREDSAKRAVNALSSRVTHPRLPCRILANGRAGHDPAPLALLERLGVRLGDAPCPHQAESDLVIHHGGYLVSCSTASRTESAM